MTGYTYDTHDDYRGFDTLTQAQQELGAKVNELARDGAEGGDRMLLLESVDAPAEDKAALRAVWA